MGADLRTTITVLVVGAVTMVKAMGIEIPEAVSDGVIAIAIFLMGFFAKDK